MVDVQPHRRAPQQRPGRLHGPAAGRHDRAHHRPRQRASRRRRRRPGDRCPISRSRSPCPASRLPIPAVGATLRAEHHARRDHAGRDQGAGPLDLAAGRGPGVRRRLRRARLDLAEHAVRAPGRLHPVGRTGRGRTPHAIPSNLVGKWRREGFSEGRLRGARRGRARLRRRGADEGRGAVAGPGHPAQVPREHPRRAEARGAGPQPARGRRRLLAGPSRERDHDRGRDPRRGGPTRQRAG